MSKENTRDKILFAASSVFCEKGYEKTTIRDICTTADVNVAAVNYHFGDKQNLFYKALGLWMEEFVEKAALRQRMASKDTPQAKFREYIHAELGALCIYNETGTTSLKKARLILQELTAENHNPEVFECHKELEKDFIYPLITDLVSPCEDPEIIHNACIAATSITTHYFLMAMDNPKFAIQNAEDLDSTTDFLTTFALGGLKAIKEKQHDV
ncbi:TetR family transcriptional regulator [Pseudodesulfovibrio sp. JC047]|uniref:TetR/AcrR family transcriptional regulator n=1 Tax=Pseudodesulfovibrio sp. JC047 TaxID=2683199 RepID=UPI0013D482E9|nr:TetR/AcrR family transcriptional regulator [Pseudodesulfovibrio sp. JC047]NDV20442.1 TetR family transcriptional regulator [Pseudodesulfovibrio sp. JC047]